MASIIFAFLDDSLMSKPDLASPHQDLPGGNVVEVQREAGQEQKGGLWAKLKGCVFQRLWDVCVAGNVSTVHIRRH
jgi:hypothetical protein